MWLWILTLLVIALSWAVWFVLRPTDPGPDAAGLPIWVPIAITAVALGALIGLAILRRIRAARAARALERAIAQQAQEQALAAKPERRAEIEELYRQIDKGIRALKASKLGRGRRGADALYVLPWYVLVGPPGAGKTTALRHSGLQFPFLDPAGGGVPGVGGTRNCDWWFTNEAILLDTAGRYTTEAEDHDEWTAFLEQLVHYRPDKPLNGVVVCVPVNEIVDASEEQVAQTARKVRAQIDEIGTQLRMVLPVYVMFTKADLVAGFVEFFGDLKKSERAQPWGATYRLDADRSQPSKLFDAEFDRLVERLHHRALRRLGAERRLETKEKIYQFPLELAAIKRPLSEFLGATFAPGAGPAPILRGFYFTSGTQEGRPLERVVGAMARAFGIRPAEDAEPAPVEPKSYFLRDVFTTVVFPDQDVAARTEAEVRRRRLQRVAAAAASFVLSVFLVVPAFLSYDRNQELIGETERISREAGAVRWDDGGKATDKVDRLEALRRQVERLDQYREDGPPIAYRWGMYQGDELFEPLLAQYIAILGHGFVRPTKGALEAKLSQATGTKYLEDYGNLKTYLLLDDKEHLQTEADWETGRLTQGWAELLAPSSGLADAELRGKLVPHVAYYVDLLRRGVIPGEALDGPLIEKTRDILSRVGPSQRYYDQFVTSLIEQKYDEAGPSTPENLKYPPITLDQIFADRPDVLTKLHSAQKARTGKWFAVLGPYTAKGHAQVLASLEQGQKLLEREKWVVPQTAEEKTQGDKVQQALERVRQDYDAEYARQWTNFFRDIEVDVPANNREAIQELGMLATPEWPYLRLLRTLEDNTQFVDPNAKTDPTGGADGGVLAQIKEKVTREIDQSKAGPLKGLLPGGPSGPRYDPIPDKFKSMVAFGVPAAAKEGQPPPPPPKLGEYVSTIEKLTGEIAVLEDGPASSDTAKATQSFEAAVQQAQGLLLSMDDTGQDLMAPLLLNPLKHSYRALVKSAGGAASGLWEATVWPHYKDRIKDRYPFALASARDASLEDVVAFFKPQTGVLWAFYDANLKGFFTKTGHEYVPSSHLAPSPRPARPFSPFHPNLMTCLRRASEITEALWPSGGERPKVVFDVNLKTVSPIVSEVVFEIDGQRRLYRNEKEFWHGFAWPAEKAPGASIRVRGSGGLDETIVRDGPWGIYRLLEAGSATAVKDRDDVFDVTWQMTAPPVTTTMEMRPNRASHPFSSSFFRGLNCPATLGDRGQGS